MFLWCARMICNTCYNKNMEKTFDFLKNRTNAIFVSTVDGDKSSCRPFGNPFLFDGRIFVMTNAKKNVAKQIAANNNLCIVAYDGAANWIRVNCQAVNESDNIEAKKVILAEFKWAESAGYTLDNPDFVIYSLSNAKSTIYGVDGSVLDEEEF